MSMRRIRDDSESEDEERPTPSTSKRIRLDEDAAEEEEVIAPSTSIIDTVKPLIVDENDGFVEGSIVKITLINFVTYDYVEVFPGPHMNMIIGPNGTGKSTIVCAIALGLGGSPSLLGRAKSIAEFVKTGTDEATIIIELKKVNVRNVVIQRSFTKTSNNTVWRLNGKQVSQKNILSIIREFNIQVDNLCQFLPQDRVAEFAELSPSELLERTQAAAGKEELHTMQKQLIEWRNTEKTLVETNEVDVRRLTTLRTKNKELERDVFRMQQREATENKLKLLKAQIPLVKYTESKSKVDRLVEELNTEKQTLERVRREMAPIANLLKEVDKEKINANRQKIAVEKNYKEAFNESRKIVDKFKELRAEATGIKRDIAQRSQNLPNFEARIQREEQRIAMKEEQVKERPSSDTSEFENGIAEINNEVSKLNEKRVEISQKSKDENSKRYRFETDLKRKTDQLREFNNKRQIRRRKLAKDFPDIENGMKWIRDNKDRLQGMVFDPIALVINLKDPRYADQVEQILGGFKSSNLKGFVCEKRADYELMTRECIDQNRWKLNIIWPDLDPRKEYSKTPVPTEDLRSRFRMDYFVSDLIEGPKLITDYLCNVANTYRIPVSLQRTAEQQIVQSGVFQKFAMDKTYYNVKVSRYGTKSKQTTTTFIRPAILLGDSVDTTGLNNLKEEYKELQERMQQCDVALQELGAQSDRIKVAIDEKRSAKDDLISQKRDVQHRIQRYEQSLRQLATMREDLEDLKKKPEMEKREIQKLESEVEKMSDEMCALLNDLERAAEKTAKAYEERNKITLLYQFVDAKYTAVRAYSRTQTTDLEQAEKSVQIAKSELKIAQNKMKRYMDDCKDASKQVPDNLREEFNEIIRTWKEQQGGLKTTLVELEGEIAAEQGKLDGITYANPDAMKHYEARKIEIEKYEKKVEDNKLELAELAKKIEALKQQWAPLIRDLVDRIDKKFSAAFERINCAGSVQVDESPDFDKWGINIYVKFRNTEKLQLLTGQRQSGGERSVSTILYLMSLQDLAASPFRVVDEINQGMDPRNERMIHEQIVQGASRPGTSQYFLITPKLLPDLYYNERMRVLCIYNSEWVPAKIKPLSEYLKHAKQRAIC